jgi:hypothetical protein
MYKFEVVYSAHHGFVCGLSFLSRSEIPYSFFCSCAFYFGLERERERERGEEGVEGCAGYARVYII